MMLSSTGSTGTFGQLMVGQGLLYLVCAPRNFADKAAGSGECLERGLKSYLEPLIIWLFITSLAAFTPFSHLK